MLLASGWREQEQVFVWNKLRKGKIRFIQARKQNRASEVRPTAAVLAPLLRCVSAAGVVGPVEVTHTAHYKPNQGQTRGPAVKKKKRRGRFLKCAWSERAENGFLTTFSSASVQGWSKRGHRVDGEVRGQKHTQAAPTEGHHLGCHQNPLGDALDCEFLPEDIPRLPRSSPLCSCLL